MLASLLLYVVRRTVVPTSDFCIIVLVPESRMNFFFLHFYVSRFLFVFSFLFCFFVFYFVVQVLRYLGVSDGNMAEGSMRLDVNVSLRPKGETLLNTKVTAGVPGVPPGVKSSI